MIIWRIWAKALGTKASENDKEADRVALVRTFFFIFTFITECFIIANAAKNLGLLGD